MKSTIPTDVYLALEAAKKITPHAHIIYNAYTELYEINYFKKETHLSLFFIPN